MTTPETTPPVTRKPDGTLTDLELYKDGGLTCRTYIQQTTELRKIGVHILLGYAVGIGLFMAKETSSNPAYLRLAFLFGGSAMIMFGIALWAVNWHFTEGFLAVRDKFLVKLETTYGFATGPWTEHKEGRSRTAGIRQRCALHGTFIAVIGLGVASLIYGLRC